MCGRAGDLTPAVAFMIPEAPVPDGLPARVVLSVIIPIWQEEKVLLQSIPTILGWPEVREVIVAAVNGETAWLPNVEAAGARCVFADQPNRGRQLNLGARSAGGEWLLFHHTDTELTRPHVQSLAALSSRAEIVGGAFYRKFDARHPSMRWAERIERWHNRTFGALYGDQSLFVRRAHFEKLGGFADIPLMEDVEFSKRLRASGPIALLDPPIASSPRKHIDRGAWRTTAQNAALIFLYKLGISPRRLHSWYYGVRKTTSTLTQLQPTHENETRTPADRTPAATDAPR